MNDALHITSLVVHVRPARVADVDRAIAALPEARIHGSDPSGKRVVTLEAPSAAAILDQVGLIQHMRGVINVAMVYQHVETLESLNTEVHDGDDPA